VGAEAPTCECAELARRYCAAVSLCMYWAPAMKRPFSARHLRRVSRARLILTAFVSGLRLDRWPRHRQPVAGASCGRRGRAVLQSRDRRSGRPLRNPYRDLGRPRGSTCLVPGRKTQCRLRCERVLRPSRSRTYWPQRPSSYSISLVRGR
jgi:hypothetical protein